MDKLNLKNNFFISMSYYEFIILGIFILFKAIYSFLIKLMT